MTATLSVVLMVTGITDVVIKLVVGYVVVVNLSAALMLCAVSSKTVAAEETCVTDQQSPSSQVS